MLRPTVHVVRTSKSCKDCKLELPMDQFYDHASSRDGKGYYCRPCLAARSRAQYATDPEGRTERVRRWEKENPEKVAARTRVYKTSGRARAAVLKYKQAHPERARSRKLRRYNMTIEQYDALDRAQHGCCACCGQPETLLHNGTGKTRRLAVDHDHADGRIRALLCAACNLGVGILKEDMGRALAVASYLEKHNRREA